MDINLIMEIQRAIDFEIATMKLNKFKEELKKQRKILAKKYHPDLNKSVDASYMSKINNAYDTLMTVNVQRPQPITRIYVNQSYYTTGTYTSTSTTSAGKTWYAY